MPLLKEFENEDITFGSYSKIGGGGQSANVCNVCRLRWKDEVGILIEMTTNDELKYDNIFCMEIGS